MLFKKLLMALFLTTTAASPALSELPHTFQAGQTAKASEVNENFQYVNKHKYVLKSNGTVIGDVVSFDNETATIVNEKGFLVTVHTSGLVRAIYTGWLYYDGDNCTGQVYVNGQLMDTVIAGTFHSSGFETYYVRKSSSNTVSVRSYLSGQGCNAYITSARGLSVAHANDFNVTGVHDIVPMYYQYDTPISLEER